MRSRLRATSKSSSTWPSSGAARVAACNISLKHSWILVSRSGPGSVSRIVVLIRRHELLISISATPRGFMERDEVFGGTGIGAGSGAVDDDCDDDADVDDVDSVDVVD